MISVEEHVDRVREQGYCIIEDAIAPALIDRLVLAIDDLHARLSVTPAANIFEGTSTLRVYNLLARARVFEEVPVHDRVLPIVEQVLDRGCLVSSLSSITILPGETAQPLHADDQLIPLPKPHVPLVCNTMWALTDFTEANGATRLAPKTHLSDRSPELGESIETVAAEMRRGSVLVWNGSLWHGGGANRTSERRIGLAMNYCAGWMRQQENQQLGIPREIAKQFSPRLRKLVGYGLYKRLLGHVDKCSPTDLLDETPPRVVVGVVGET
ncbi:MAG: phytanoyl-CoA dioxygenase family protein [Labilithrix sp.]|nr:phytanoyl-CoA dioxygenase family protein [Labilithrix sp.]